MRLHERAFLRYPAAPSEISILQYSSRPSILMPTAKTATGDQQKSHQKQQKPSGKNSGNQNPRSQRNRQQPQKKGAVSVIMHLPRLLPAAVYAISHRNVILTIIVSIISHIFTIKQK